jgi:hypothetical protein
MPRIFRAIGDELNQRFNRKNTAPVNELVGFQGNGAVVIRDRRGTLKAEIPDISAKSETMGDDPLAIYKPTGAKAVDAAKAMANFNGWTYAAVNAIASEVANIQFRLYKINGDDQAEQDDQLTLANRSSGRPNCVWITTSTAAPRPSACSISSPLMSRPRSRLLRKQN